MAVTTTPRLGLTRWSAGTDPLRRSQLDTSLGNLEAWAMRGEAGTLANRPAAGIRDRYYTDTDTGVTYRDSGTAWTVVGSVLAGLATVKATAGQAGNLTEWRDAAGALLASAAVDGTLTGKALVASGSGATVPGLKVTGATGQSAPLASFRSSAGTEVAAVSATGGGTFGTTSVTGSDTTTPPLTARLAAGSTAPSIARFQNSAGTSLAWVDTSGAFTGSGLDAINTDDQPSAVVILVRGATGQTGKLTVWQDSTGAEVANIGAAGAINGPSLGLTGVSPTFIVQSVKGAVSQTGDLTRWRDSANATLAAVKADGSSTWPSISATATAPAVVPLTVKGAASQTANLLEAYDSAAARKFYVAPSGDVVTVGQATLGGNLTLGDVTSTTQRIVYLRALNSVDTKAYEARRYLANTTGAAGNRVADVLYAAGTEVARTELQADGNLSVVRGGLLAAGPVTGPSATFTAGTATTNPLVVKGATAQSADLAQWRTSADAILASLASSGQFRVGSSVGGGAFTVQGDQYTADAPLIRARPNASQTADLLRLENSAGTGIAGVKVDGTVYGPNLADTGWITTAAAGWTAAAGFNTLTGQVRRLNGVVYLNVQVNVATAITTSGNITNVNAVNLPAGWAPSQSNGALNSGGSGNVSQLIASTSAIVLAATTQTYAVGDALGITGAFAL